MCHTTGGSTPFFFPGNHEIIVSFSEAFPSCFPLPAPPHRSCHTHRVWEYIRKLNPGGKGRRHWFKRGGTKTSSKGSHYNHTSITFKKEISWKLWELRPNKREDNRNGSKPGHVGREGGRQQVTWWYYVARKLPCISRRRSTEQVSRRGSSEHFVMVGGRSTPMSS